MVYMYQPESVQTRHLYLESLSVPVSYVTQSWWSRMSHNSVEKGLNIITKDKVMEKKLTSTV
jgi:hypothetical protein